MVFLILTRQGFDEIRACLGHVPSSLWVADKVLAPEEIEEIRAAGCNVTTFLHSIDAGAEDEMEEALATIADHHLGARIWVEVPPCLS